MVALSSNYMKIPLCLVWPDKGGYFQKLLGKMFDGDFIYDGVQAIGINLRPRSEKNHNFSK